MLDVKKLRKRREKATRGAYLVDKVIVEEMALKVEHYAVTDSECEKAIALTGLVPSEQGRNDAEYIAAACNALPEALDLIEKMTAALLAARLHLPGVFVTCDLGICQKCHETTASGCHHYCSRCVLEMIDEVLAAWEVDVSG